MLKGCSFASHEYASGCEDEYCLEWLWTPQRPATYYDPPEGGVEPRDAYLNGERIGLGDVPDEIMDRLVRLAYDEARDSV